MLLGKKKKKKKKSTKILLPRVKAYEWSVHMSGRKVSEKVWSYCDCFLDATDSCTLAARGTGQHTPLTIFWLCTTILNTAISSNDFSQIWNNTSTRSKTVSLNTLSAFTIARFLIFSRAKSYLRMNRNLSFVTQLLLTFSQHCRHFFKLGKRNVKRFGVLGNQYRLPLIRSRKDREMEYYQTYDNYIQHYGVRSGIPQK